MLRFTLAAASLARQDSHSAQFLRSIRSKPGTTKISSCIQLHLEFQLRELSGDNIFLRRTAALHKDVERAPAVRATRYGHPSERPCKPPRAVTLLARTWVTPFSLLQRPM
mmetsp:Transcript_36075/g.66713  ORF Transcript_36075/g.66713 Transcript_36075/m.66713 type:complete len:110 (-) Transcript_36075:500-829(-)